MRALLLLAFGGPRSLEEVEFLLTQLFKRRKPSKEQVEKVKERYRLIGGSSPLLEITRNQAKGLEQKLSSKGYSFKSYVGMRYSHPLIEETLNQMIEEGVDDIVAIPMAPFRSSGSTGAYIEEVNRVKKGLGKEIKITFIEGWHSHPLFLEALQEKIQEGLMKFTFEERKKNHLIFTAHSLPTSMIKNDPYVSDMEASVRGVLEYLEPHPWHMAFQSKGSSPEEWVGPEVESVLLKLSEEGVREILIVPIGFVSDHIEILYDIDILYRKKAESLGMVLKRSPSLNSSEKFIEALAAIIEENIKGFKDSRIQGV